MNNRDILIDYLKKRIEKEEYIQKLKENFENKINYLDYDLQYLLRLKDFFYGENYIFIKDCLKIDINELLNAENSGNYIENQNIRENLNFYRKIDFENILFTFSNYLIYTENQKIYFFENCFFTEPKKDLIENIINYQDNKFMLNEVKIFDDLVLPEQIIDFFKEKLEDFHNKEVEQSNTKLKQVLSQLMSGNNEINWIPVEPYTQLLEVNENTICEKNVDYLLKFVKLDSFLNTKRKSLINIHKEIVNTKDEDFIFKIIPVLIKQIEYYNQLLLLSINMIVALKSNKMIIFFKIYETFDQIGVFDSNWEKSLLNKMDELNISIKDLVVQIQQMEMRLNQKIEDLGYDIQRNIDEMKDTVINEISQLNDGSSILTLINTFQLIGIKNKLK